MQMKKKMTKNKLLLYSGGLDSTTLLYLNKDSIALCLFFNYKSKHNEMEYSYAKKHCERLNIQLKRIEIDLPFETALTSDKISEEGLDNKATVVPFRNGIFLSYATAFCETLNLDTILIGINNPTTTIYRDTTDRFRLWFEQLVEYGYNMNLAILAPLQGLTKKQTADLLLKNGIKTDETYSCYKGTEIPCGKCSACIKRQQI